MKVISQEVHVERGGFHYVIGESDILKCRPKVQGFPEYHKEFSPPLDMPFGLYDAYLVIEQANETAEDTFDRSQFKVDWWCPTCNSYISGAQVTVQEYHQTCGTYVGDAVPPEPLAKKGTEDE